MARYYKDYAAFLAEIFESKMQKITVNAGFSCPNRDGTIGRGGCVYCNNVSFSPALGAGSVAAQIERGKQFFGHKYPSMRYLAYFQSYTNTHAPVEDLLRLYREALSVDKVDGLIIGTRPDCVSDRLLSELSRIDKLVMMEYGAETSHDCTLSAINRCHTWAQTVDAVERSVKAGLRVGLHFIMGLPGETVPMMMQTVERLAALPVSTVKFHQLQIIKGTVLERETVTGADGKMSFRGLELTGFTADEYVALCVEIVKKMRALCPGMAVERFTSQSPDGLLVWPKWGFKNYQFVNLLNNRLAACGVTSLE